MDKEEKAKKLSKDGLVTIKDYFTKSHCDDIYREVRQIIDEEKCDVIPKSENPGFSTLSSWDGTVISKRSGRDEGFYDIFNIDEMVSRLEDFKNDGDIMEIIKLASEKQPSPESTNIYWKESVTETRGPHHDTFGEKYKSFVYLTDVSTNKHGPYSYVKGSHNPSRVERFLTSRINKLKRNPSTDSVFYREDDAIQLTAPKGTLIISNQSGVHYGQPQAEGFERMLTTTHYKL